MTRTYEQKVTIVLSQEEATCLSAALSSYRRLHIDEYDRAGIDGKKEVENSHPNSTTGIAHKLHHELSRVALGDKNQPHVTYEMVPIQK